MTKDLGLGIIALLFSAFYISQASRIPTSALGDTVGAGGVPLVLGWIMAAAGALLILHDLWLRRAGPYIPAPVSAEFAEPRRLVMIASGIVLITIIYLSVLRFLGYIPATALFLAALLAYQRVSLKGRILLVPIGGAVALWLLFDAFLGIHLPDGLLAGIL
jgi:putative tricarboxylic transport membrane protein